MSLLTRDINDKAALQLEPQATKVWFEADAICVSLVDGRKLSVPLSFYPLLSQASPKALNDFELFGQGTGIYFKQLDEYLSIKGLVYGRKQIGTKNFFKRNKGGQEIQE